jgi:rhamnogalacturonan endolyase
VLRLFFVFALAWTQNVSALEVFDRGVVALPLDGIKVYVGWRLLAEDPDGVAFNVYRSETADGDYVKRNDQPISETTNFVDSQAYAGRTYYYRVHAIAGGEENAGSKVAKVVPTGARQGYVSIPLAGDYDFRTCGIADLDGDGAYDFVIKQPSSGVDPGGSHWRASTHTYKMEAYKSDGTFMWRHDMGWALEAGIWYTPFVVTDADMDGKAEVYTKYGEGDPREEDGRVLEGPEYLAKLDGLTGVVQKKTPWHPRKGYSARPSEKGTRLEGYNLSSRNTMAVAHLDGVAPSVIVQRGTYGLIRMSAFDGDLNKHWTWDSTMESQNYAGQGSHGFLSVDVDDDGKDELLYGAACLDDNGKGLWSLEMGHPDVAYVGDIDPARKGLEVFYGFETKQSSQGVSLVVAKSGEILWSYKGPTTHVHNQGMARDILAKYPGIECFGGEQNGSMSWFYNAKGKLLFSNDWFAGLSPRAARWDADAQSEVILRQGGNPKSGVRQPRSGPRPALTPAQQAERRLRFSRPRYHDILAEGYRADETSVLSTIQGRMILIADVLGDWREEIITSQSGELRIYSTTIPAKTKQVCLMQDRLYRSYIANSTSGYFYPPLLGRRK